MTSIVRKTARPGEICNPKEIPLSEETSWADGRMPSLRLFVEWTENKCSSRDERTLNCFIGSFDSQQEAISVGNEFGQYLSATFPGASFKESFKRRTYNPNQDVCIPVDYPGPGISDMPIFVRRFLAKKSKEN